MWARPQHRPRRPHKATARNLNSGCSSFYCKRRAVPGVVVADSSPTQKTVAMETGDWMRGHSSLAPWGHKEEGRSHRDSSARCSRFTILTLPLSSSSSLSVSSPPSSSSTSLSSSSTSSSSASTSSSLTS